MYLSCAPTCYPFILNSPKLRGSSSTSLCILKPQGASSRLLGHDTSGLPTMPVALCSFHPFVMSPSFLGDSGLTGFHHRPSSSGVFYDISRGFSHISSRWSSHVHRWWCLYLDAFVWCWYARLQLVCGPHWTLDEDTPLVRVAWLLISLGTVASPMASSTL
jgi:hypothetical protein